MGGHKSTKKSTQLPRRNQVLFVEFINRNGNPNGNLSQLTKPTSTSKGCKPIIQQYLYAFSDPYIPPSQQNSLIYLVSLGKFIKQRISASQHPSQHFFMNCGILRQTQTSKIFTFTGYFQVFRLICLLGQPIRTEREEIGQEIFGNARQPQATLDNQIYKFLFLLTTFLTTKIFKGN